MNLTKNLLKVLTISRTLENSEGEKVRIDFNWVGGHKIRVSESGEKIDHYRVGISYSVSAEAVLQSILDYELD